VIDFCDCSQLQSPRTLIKWFGAAKEDTDELVADVSLDTDKADCSIFKLFDLLQKSSCGNIHTNSLSFA